MHPRTQATVAKLEKVQWFRAVGQKDTEGAVVLSSWEEAIRSCSSDDWQDLLLEAANRYCEQLVVHSKERFRQWNTIVDELKPVVVSLVARKTKQVVRANQLPQVFVDTVNWDILHLVMEAEYADVYPPGFYASQAYWYVQGHFPCGWQGAFPDGKLVIY